jgi:uncharacterized metal-binding protein
MKPDPQCDKCNVRRCAKLNKDLALPDFCPTQNYPDIIEDTTSRQKNDPDILAINSAWVELVNRMAQNPNVWTRLDQVMEYARIRGAKKLGIATCFALLPECRMLTQVLEGNGFEAVSVSCLTGEVKPEDVNVSREGVFCNPLMQAEVLNRAGTQLNIILGLCIGHDILFTKNSKADVTTLVVKDGALGHNPVAALYMSSGYYRHRFIKKAPKPGGQKK